MSSKYKNIGQTRPLLFVFVLFLIQRHIFDNIKALMVRPGFEPGTTEYRRGRIYWAMAATMIFLLLPQDHCPCVNKVLKYRLKPFSSATDFGFWVDYMLHSLSLSLSLSIFFLWFLLQTFFQHNYILLQKDLFRVKFWGSIFWRMTCCCWSHQTYQSNTLVNEILLLYYLYLSSSEINNR